MQLRHYIFLSLPHTLGNITHTPRVEKHTNKQKSPHKNLKNSSKQNKTTKYVCEMSGSRFKFKRRMFMPILLRLSFIRQSKTIGDRWTQLTYDNLRLNKAGTLPKNRTGHEIRLWWMSDRNQPMTMSNQWRIVNFFLFFLSLNHKHSHHYFSK